MGHRIALLLVILLFGLASAQGPYQWAEFSEEVQEFVELLGETESEEGELEAQEVIRQDAPLAEQCFRAMLNYLENTKSIHPGDEADYRRWLNLIASALRRDDLKKMLDQKGLASVEAADEGPMISAEYETMWAKYLLLVQLGNWVETAKASTRIDEWAGKVANGELPYPTHVQVDPMEEEARRLTYVALHLVSLEMMGLESEVIERAPTLNSFAQAALSKGVDAQTVREAEMDFHLLMTRAGRRSGRADLVHKHLPEATRLAREIDSPAAQMVRFVCANYRYELELLKDPVTTVPAFLSRHDQAWTDFAPGPYANAYWVFALDGVRFWLLEAAARAQDPQLSKSDVSKLEALVSKDLQRLEQMLDDSLPNLEAARTTGSPIEEIHRYASVSFSSLTGITEVQLDLARHHREAAHLESAQRLLGKAQSRLAQVAPLIKEVDALGRKLSLDLTAASAYTRVLGRLKEEQAHLQLAAEKPDFEQARLLMEEALVLYKAGADSLSEASLIPHYAVLLFQSGAGADRANQEAARGLELSESIGAEPARIEALLARARLLDLQDQGTQAIVSLQQAVELIEGYVEQVGAGERGAEAIRGRYRRVYELLARLQLQAGQLQESLVTLDRLGQLNSAGGLGALASADPAQDKKLQQISQRQARTRSLKEELLAQERLGANPKTATRVSELKSQLAQQEAQFRAELEGLEPKYRELVSFDPLKFTELYKSIPEDAAIVQLFPQPEQLYLFVVTSDDLKVHTVKTSQKELDELVAKTRRALIRGGSPEQITPLLARLHSMIVAPVSHEISGKKILAFIPSGTLHYLPMQCLGRADASGTFKYLIEEHQVVTLVRAGDIVRLAEAARSPKGNVVTIGNPDSTLPEAEAEATEIGAMFAQADVLLTQQATLERLLKIGSQTSYLHLATHGILNSREPKASYLVLAQDSKLDFQNIQKLPIQATRLVTLSACQTALGETRPGSEVTSIAQAFWLAGPTTVVASLWKVSDSSSRLLMVDFYHRLQQGESPGAAMQAAQLTLLQQEQTRHPYHWAPFILWGDWR